MDGRPWWRLLPCLLAIGVLGACGEGKAPAGRPPSPLGAEMSAESGAELTFFD